MGAYDLEKLKIELDSYSLTCRAIKYSKQTRLREIYKVGFHLPKNNKPLLLCHQGPYSQRHGFSSSHVWMWALDHKESWARKNCCFQTVELEKILESPLDCNEIKPVNPKGHQPEYSLEGLMLKLKLQYFGHLMRRANSLKKTLLLGKIEGKRRRGQQRMRWLDGIIGSMDMSLS